jgi:hypothetical protein
MNGPRPADWWIKQGNPAGIITMTCELVGLIRAAWIDLARFPYSSIHTCAYEHAIELPDFFGHGRLPCVPYPHDTCFQEADKSVVYRLVCLWTANSGLSKRPFAGAFWTCTGARYGGTEPRRWPMNG